MSATRDDHIDLADWTTFKFIQKVPIPVLKLDIRLNHSQSYLVALAVGDLVSRDIGPRSKLWTEQEQVVILINIL